jgi:hypothetical protein
LTEVIEFKLHFTIPLYNFLTTYSITSSIFFDKSRQLHRNWKFSYSTLSKPFYHIPANGKKHEKPLRVAIEIASTHAKPAFVGWGETQEESAKWRVVLSADIISRSNLFPLSVLFRTGQIRLPRPYLPVDRAGWRLWDWRNPHPGRW